MTPPIDLAAVRKLTKDGADPEELGALADHIEAHTGERFSRVTLTLSAIGEIRDGAAALRLVPAMADEIEALRTVAEAANTYHAQHASDVDCDAYTVLGDALGAYYGGSR